MSCLLLYLGTDRVFEPLLHHTLLVGPGYRDFIRSVTRGRALPRSFSTYVHAPARSEAAMAAPDGDSLCVLLPVPNLAAPVDWAREEQGLRDALVADLERTFGLHGLDASIRSPASANSRSIRSRRSWSSPRSTSVLESRPARSIHTSSGPLTKMSVTLSSSISLVRRP